jgi:hypothetical protein
MERVNMPRGQKNLGLHPILAILWVMNYIIVILLVFISIFERFWYFWGDIGPFFRPDLGGKLGDGYQIQIDINNAFLRPWEEV